MLEEAAQAGFGGLELGPYGYMPLDIKRVSDELQVHGLMIVAGTIFDDLVSPDNRANLLRQTREICALNIGLPNLTDFSPLHVPLIGTQSVRKSRAWRALA